MILEAALAYICPAEPLGFQKEAAARDLFSEFGRRWLREEHRHFLDEAVCTHGADFDPEGLTGVGGFAVSLVECRYQTPCGVEIVRPVWHEPLVGAYTTAEREPDNIARECPEMLRPAVLDEVRGRMEQGG